MNAVSRRRNTAFAAAGVATVMGVFAFASAPLYDMFCRATGFGGTTQRAAVAPTPPVSARTINVRFNADVAPGLPWSFQPRARVVTVRVGDETLAYYRAENRGAAPTTGTATFNVTPTKAGKFFVKMACFCFQEQALAVGGSADLPVSFYVDPAMMDDPHMADVDTVTLSYTFFPAPGAAPVSSARQASNLKTTE
jgi:cytochrome c oxidase assembly protein subunit 11